nr:immunoglobulin light chain junction region [Macaca mulatta]MOV78538.1 immunoglobulin light chain junction region [Macaca mulatta]MOV79283.1 immunoglobulin light chain junction region [Macaca mulatta]MOV79363.1 immunoglobulin light chain junction region [Macaca mulatta]MOV79954.1 immunoglobulin light chain junction region [Macaca mulatta]
CQHSYDTPYTF